MGLFLEADKEVGKYQERADLEFIRYGEELASDYTSVIAYLVDRLIADYPYDDFLVSRNNIRSDDEYFNIVGRVLFPWWEEVGGKAAQYEKDAFRDIRDIMMRSTEELFDVVYRIVPDDQVPVAVSPKKATDPSMQADTFEEVGPEGFPRIEFVLGEGGIDAEFDRFLDEMFDAKIDSRNAIRTLAEKDVALVRSRFIEFVRRGESIRTAKQAITRDLLGRTEGVAREKLVAYNVERITRTVHQRAALATVFSYARRNPYVKKLIRHTGPRPCIACVALDGKVYRTYQEFRDHPNGMCTVVPQLPSVEEMKKEAGADVSSKAEKRWKRSTGFRKNRRYEFLEATNTRQQHMIGNIALFNFWKREDFPIEKFASYQDKWGYFQKASYRELYVEAEALGGVSYPKASFSSRKDLKMLNSRMDARDRAAASLTISRNRFDQRTNKYGKPIYVPTISSSLVDEYPLGVQEEVRRILAGYEGVGFDDLPYFVYNDVARVLSLGIRKAKDGIVYYVRKNA